MYVKSIYEEIDQLHSTETQFMNKIYLISYKLYN